MASRRTNLKSMNAAVSRWIEEAQGRADGAAALMKRAAWVERQIGVLAAASLRNCEPPAALVGLTVTDLIGAQADLERAARGGAPLPPVTFTILPPAPSLPSRKLARVSGCGELSRTLKIERRGDGFALVIEVWEIDSRGDKDAYSEAVSEHDTLAQAEAAMNAYGAEREAA